MCSQANGSRGAGTRVKPRTVESWETNLSCHLLPFFAPYDVTDITVDLVERFKLEKLRERER